MLGSLLRAFSEFLASHIQLHSKVEFFFLNSICIRQLRFFCVFCCSHIKREKRSLVPIVCKLSVRFGDEKLITLHCIFRRFPIRSLSQKVTGQKPPNNKSLVKKPQGKWPSWKTAAPNSNPPPKKIISPNQFASQGFVHDRDPSEGFSP